MATLRDALRNWAQGIYTLEAGVELLIQHGKAIQENAPWIIEEHDQAPDQPRLASIATEKLLYASGAWSGGEQRVTRIAVSLLEGHPVDLSEILSGLDREQLNLVLAAAAHAGGSHEHSRFVFGENGKITGSETPASLHPWPLRAQPSASVTVDPMREHRDATAAN